MTIIVGKHKFKNKSAADKHIKDLLTKYENGKPFSATDCNFVKSALKYRRDFGDGVDLLTSDMVGAFVKQINGKHYLHIKRDDKSVVEINHNKLFSRKKTKGKFNNTNQMNRFLRACRYEIRDQSITPGLEAHHSNIRFRNLVENFINQHNIDVDTIKVSKTDGGRSAITFADRNIAKKWQKYHNDNATIVLVSPKLHAQLHKKRKIRLS